MLHSNEPATALQFKASTTEPLPPTAAGVSQPLSSNLTKSSPLRGYFTRSAPTDADQTLKTIVYHFRESGLRRKQSALVQTLQKQTKLHPGPLQQPYTQSIFAQFLSKATC